MDRSSSLNPSPAINPPIMLFGKRIRSGQLISSVTEIKEEFSPRGVDEGAGVSCGVSSDEEQDRISDKTKISTSTDNGPSRDLINCSATETNFQIKQTINNSNGASCASVSVDNHDHDDDGQSPSFRTSKTMKCEFSNCEIKSEIIDQNMENGEKQGAPAPARADNPHAICKPNEQLVSRDVSSGAVPCPRCNSSDTKFCYFNNYNVNQPRHFCKRCQRYWTAGGTLRNVPIGSGKRKSKQSLRAAAAASNLSDAGACRKSNPEPSIHGLITPSAPLNCPIDGLITPPVAVNYAADGLLTHSASLNYPMDGIINAMNSNQLGLIDLKSQGPIIRSLGASISGQNGVPSSYVANLETSLNHHQTGLQGTLNGFMPTSESNAQSQGALNVSMSSETQEPINKGTTQTSQENLNSVPKNPYQAFTFDKVNNLANLAFSRPVDPESPNNTNNILALDHRPALEGDDKTNTVLGSNDHANESNPNIEPLASQTCTPLTIPSLVITTNPNLVNICSKKSHVDDVVPSNQYAQLLPMLGGVWPCFYNMFWASSLSPHQAMMAWSQFSPMVNMNQPWSLSSLEAFTKITNNLAANTTSQLVMGAPTSKGCIGIPPLNDENVAMNNLGHHVDSQHTKL